MNKINYILTQWIKIKLRRWDFHKKTDMNSSGAVDHNILKIYQEYEERKRIKKIKFSLLIKNSFSETKIENYK